MNWGSDWFWVPASKLKLERGTGETVPYFLDWEPEAQVTVFYNFWETEP